MQQLVECCILFLFEYILVLHSYINSFMHLFPCDRIRPICLCVVSSVNLTFVCPCIANIVVNDDQQDTTIFGIFIYS